MSDSGSEFTSTARRKAGFRSKLKGLFKAEENDTGSSKKRNHSSEGSRLLSPASRSVMVARFPRNVMQKTHHPKDALTEPLALRIGSSPDTVSSDSPHNIETTPLVSDDTSIQELPGIGAQARALATRKQLCPIHELWNQAYDELKEKEEELMQDYEKCLGGDISTIAGLTLSLLELKKRRQEEMANLLQKRVDEAKRNAWKLRFGGKDIPVKDLAEPVVGIIKWADDYISTALASNPYASIAWSGISLLLPLVVNPSQQAASLTELLAVISDLIVRSKLREDLYQRRYESGSSDGNSLQVSHTLYRDTLQKLYVQILKVQATSICYLRKNDAFQIGLDMIKWNDWKAAMSDIQHQEDAFRALYDIWKDQIYQEECDATSKRHEESMSQMKSLSSDVYGLRLAIEGTNRDKKRTELLKWISDIDPSSNFNAAIEKHELHTSQWLIKNNEDFDKWQNTPKSLLWLNGKAGSGKSILSASVIKSLLDRSNSDPEIAIAYYFFSFSDDQKQNAIGMLASVMKQLCCCRPDTPVSVNAISKYKDRGQRPDIKTLENALLDTMHGFSSVYIILDALDECPFESGALRPRKILLDSLSRIHDQAPNCLHLFLTSRREHDINARLRKKFSIDPSRASPNIDLDLAGSKALEAIESDIKLHITQTLKGEDFDSWDEAPGLKDEAISKLVENADGMFQYVSCQLDALKTHHDPASIRQALRNLPEGLDETYHRILQVIENRYPKYKKQIASALKWLAHSFSPLSIEELAEVFILDPEKPLPFDENSRMLSIDDVLNYLPGLVVKYPVGFGVRVRVRFAHFSIKEYLSSDRIHEAHLLFSVRDQDSSHLHIAESCLAYHLQLSNSIVATTDTVRPYALWSYVSRIGMQHLEMVARERWTLSIIEHATGLFTAYSQALLNYRRIGHMDFDLRIKDLPLPLYCAAGMGLLQLAAELIQNGAEVDEVSPDVEYQTAIAVAAMAGHDNLVKLLLNKNAAINGQSEFKYSPLQAAAMGGQFRTICLLLDSGADVNIEGGKHGSALQAAAISRTLGTVQLLLDRGADVNIGGGEYGSALQAAANYSSSDTAKLLLDHGADVNIGGGRYGSALQAAAYCPSLSTVKLLLDHGADVNIGGGVYGSALQAAVLRPRSLHIVQLLLDHGVDVHQKGGLYGNAIQATITTEFRQSWKIAKLLYLQGAKVDPPGEEWDKLLARIKREDGGCSKAERLRKFQKDPEGYIERRGLGFGEE